MKAKNIQHKTVFFLRSNAKIYYLTLYKRGPFKRDDFNGKFQEINHQRESSWNVENTAQSEEKQRVQQLSVDGFFPRFRAFGWMVICMTK